MPDLPQEDQKPTVAMLQIPHRRGLILPAPLQFAPPLGHDDFALHLRRPIPRPLQLPHPRLFERARQPMMLPQDLGVPRRTLIQYLAEQPYWKNFLLSFLFSLSICCLIAIVLSLLVTLLTIMVPISPPPQYSTCFQLSQQSHYTQILNPSPRSCPDYYR